MDQLECEWFAILDLLTNTDAIDVSRELIEPALFRFLHRAQDIMRGTSSNYKLPRLYIGLLTALIVVLVSFASAYKTLSTSGFPGLFLVATTICNGCMMFASSYVEEEQQFWYWVSSAWSTYLYMKS
jgi:ethanolaminephosphotransferase